jgi:hypothetical protein
MLSESLSARTTLESVSLGVMGVRADGDGGGPVEQNLILLGATDDVEHDIGLHLEDNNLAIIKDDVGRLLGSLLWTGG